METPRGFMDDIHESEGGESVMEERNRDGGNEEDLGPNGFRTSGVGKGSEGGESEKTVWCLLG